MMTEVIPVFIVKEMSVVTVTAAITADALPSTSNGYGTRTVSTAAASGGSDGDIHYQVAT